MMANRNVPGTPSQEELRENENIKNVKNSEEREADNLNSTIDTEDSVSPTMSTSTEAAAKREAGGSPVPKQATKIPGPVALGPSPSTFQMSNRKYTSVLDLNRSRQSSPNDSGIQMDSSLSDVEVTPLAPIPKPVLSFRSEMELQQAEQKTLQELQRVVAEMEAEVALDCEELEEEEEQQQDPLDATNAQQAPELEQESVQQEVTVGVQNQVEKSEPIEEQLDATEAQQTKDPAQERVQKQDGEDDHQVASKAQQNPPTKETEEGSEYVQDNVKNSSQKEDSLAKEIGQNCIQKPAPQVIQTNVENYGQADDLQEASKVQEEPKPNEPGEELAQKPTLNVNHIATIDELPQDNQQMLKKSPQEEPETEKELLEPLPQEQIANRSVEEHLQQAFENINQTEEQPVDELNGSASGGPETHAHNQDLLHELDPEIADADLATTSQPKLIAQPSQASNVQAFTENDRRMIRLEELLLNANNVELLRRLLQIGAETQMDSEPDFGTQDSSGEEKDTEVETESGPGTSTASGTEASTEDDAEMNDEEDEDETEVTSQALNKETYSLMERILSGKLVNLACPLIICGLAAGLIYLARKA